MRENWSGFYGPSYRLMLEYADHCDLPESVWKAVINMHMDNPGAEGHWEFLALGYLLLFDRSPSLSEAAALRLSALLPRFNTNHPATNWRLLAQIVRRRIQGGDISTSDFKRVGLIQAKNGFLQDMPGDESSQYHALLVFLMLRFSDPSDNDTYLCVSRAFDWLATCHQRYGDPSPLGRGRFQLFGYAAMLAATAQAERWKIPIPDAWYADICTRLTGHHLCSSISPNWDGPHRHYLLHGYNTIDDYPAFALIMTHGITSVKSIHNQKNNQALWWHPLDRFGSGLLADDFGVRVSILASQSIQPDVSRRRLLQQLIRKKEPYSVAPKQLCVEQTLPKNNIRVHNAGETLHFSWRLDSQNVQESNYTVWSHIPARYLDVKGNVEMANLEWQQPYGKKWYGIDIRAVRTGSVQLSW